MNSLITKAFRFFASYGLSCVLFLLLLLLTYLGTLYQVENGLYQAKERYFQSVFLIHHFWGILPVPLPGGGLLLALVCLNTLCGGVLRARKGWAKAGVLITHAGVLILLIGGYVAFQFSTTGYLALYEGETSSWFTSRDEVEIGLTQVGAEGPVTEYLIRQDDFARTHSGATIRRSFPDTSFVIALSGFSRNAQVADGQSPTAPEAAKTDGRVKRAMPLAQESGMNSPAIYALVERQDGTAQRFVLSKNAITSPVFEADGKRWTLELRQREHELPFSVYLNDFSYRKHPGTEIPSDFTSMVTVSVNGVEQEAKVSMNEPLREQGYTLYQSSWGPRGASPDQRLYSVFEVSRNPADKFPLYACVVISGGLVLHFMLMLFRYLRREARKRS